jgi:hypothetical protein
MSFARTMSHVALATTLGLAACTDAAKDTLAPEVSADYDENGNWIPRPPVFNQGCNGNNSMQLSARPATFRQPQLERVIVYGAPVQRPYRGYGDSEMYAGITQTFTYNRDMLDQCSFGTQNTFQVGGPVEDDTLDAPEVAPEGVDQEVWNSLPPRVRKQLFEAASYLADHYITNDIPEIGSVARGIRTGLIFSALARGFNDSQAQLGDRRRETVMWHETRGTNRQLNERELQRIDALLLGCATSTRFRGLRSWLPSTAEEYAARVAAAWAADQTQYGADRYLETQLALLGAIGAQMGREGTSCAQAARYHFENRTKDLYDPTQPGNPNENLF